MPRKRRKYSETHPWITFEVDLERASPRLWLLLGEARARCLALARVPLPPAISDQLHRLYLVKAIHGTTAIEGNTLSEEQVAQAIDTELEVPPSQQYLKREVENVQQAFDEIAETVFDSSGSPGLTVQQIRALNQRVLAGLDLPDEVVPGELRNHSVTVGRYLAPPAEDCEYLLEELCRWVSEAPPSEDRRMEFAAQVVRAVLAHLYIAWIHPFGDGNGRTARLVEYFLLLHAGIPTPAVHLLSNHYHLTRAKYMQELDRASRSGGEILPFLNYSIEGFAEQLAEQLGWVRGQQMVLAWKDFVTERFQSRPSEADRRRRALLLHLSFQKPVRKDEIRALSPEIAEWYRGKTVKTVTRDLNSLIKEGLLRQAADGYRANTELILKFFPQRRRIESEFELSDHLSN